MSATGKRRGFSLVELLVVVAIVSIVTAAITSVFRSQSRAHRQQELLVAMEENLRFAMSLVKDDLRRAGFGDPRQTSTLPLATWVPAGWFTGFTSNPLVVQGAGTSPDTISIASCTQQPVAYLNANSVAGALNLSLDVTPTAAGLDAGNRRLIRIGDGEFAWVTSTGNPMDIDTDPVTPADQGLGRAYFGDTTAGTPDTPICRVDITTYAIQTTGGGNRLTRNLNQGAGAIVAAEEITDLQISNPGGCPAPTCYQIALSARTERNYPGVASRPTRTLTSRVARKN